MKLNNSWNAENKMQRNGQLKSQTLQIHTDIHTLFLSLTHASIVYVYPLVHICTRIPSYGIYAGNILERINIESMSLPLSQCVICLYVYFHSDSDLSTNYMRLAIVSDKALLLAMNLHLRWNLGDKHNCEILTFLP